MTTFRRATAADDGVIRALLRENSMSTWVDMTMEYEPSFFAARHHGGEEWTVLAEEGAHTVGMYSAAVLRAYVNGGAAPTGYLGGLRIVPAHRHRVRHLRAGYASVPAFAPAAIETDWWFTVVATGNERARRLLEAGVRGLPAYRHHTDYVTFALPTSRGRSRRLWRPACAHDIPRLLAFHREQAAAFQFAPVLDADLLGQIGVDRFVVHEDGTSIGAMAAVWDQRHYKQIVARGYRRPIGALVPAYNLLARNLRRVPLPCEGNRLEHVSLAFLAIAPDAARDSRVLLADLLSRCAAPIASVGVHAQHPLVPLLRDLKPLSYPSRIYIVAYGEPPVFDGRPAQPEAALL